MIKYNMQFKPIHRIIPIEKIIKRKGILLLGPRRTGKSFFIKHQLRPDKIINLIESDTFRKLSARPEFLREIITSGDKLIAIDEIQKLPHLMDEIHNLIENTSIKFILTGSSARKLSRSYTSLMAGRLKKFILHPFTFKEMKNFNLEHVLQFGSLPPVFNSEDPWDELQDYTGLYLREEIQAEALVRKIENFSRFIDFAAMSNGEVLNYESIGRNAQVPARTIREYYSLLEDTLMGTMLSPLKSSKKRKCLSSGKFYFFDLGVLNSILGRKSVSSKTKEFGELFESYIYLELKAYIDYFASYSRLNFWRIDSENEVDFIINEEIAIEVKATEFVIDKHLKGLRKYAELGSVKRMIVVSRDTTTRIIGNIEVKPYREFLKQLWSGQIFS
jgi:predicted AAA+ superfamily ATPase